MDPSAPAPEAPPEAPEAPEAAANVAPEAEEPQVTALGLPILKNRKETENVPGLDLTWKQADILEFTDETLVKLARLKAEAGGSVKLAVIPLDTDVYVARNCTRLEWRRVVNELSDLDDTRARLEKENSTPQAIDQIVTMIAEDRLVERFLVHPKLQLLEIRGLPPGEVKTLHDSIMMHLGYGQQPRAIKI